MQTDDFLHDLGGLLDAAARREEQRGRRRPAPRPRMSVVLATVTAIAVTALGVAARPWEHLAGTGPETDATTTVVPTPDKPDPNEPTGAGRHDTRLETVAYGATALRVGTVNRLRFNANDAFLVSLANRGENDEFDLKVTLRVRTTDGPARTLRATVPHLKRGEDVQVRVPLEGLPPVAQALIVDANVAAVPGETNLEDNTASYSLLFGDQSIVQRAVADTRREPACRPDSPPTSFTLVDQAPLPALIAALPALATSAEDAQSILRQLPKGLGGTVLRTTPRALSFPGDVHAIVFVTAGHSAPLTDRARCAELRAARATALSTGAARAEALAALAARPDVAADTQTLNVHYGRGDRPRGGAGMPLRPGSPIPTGLVGFGGSGRPGERVYAGIARANATAIRVDGRTIPVRDGFFAFTRATGQSKLRIEYLDAQGRVIGR